MRISVKFVPKSTINWRICATLGVRWVNHFVCKDLKSNTFADTALYRICVFRSLISQYGNLHVYNNNHQQTRHENLKQNNRNKSFHL